MKENNNSYKNGKINRKKYIPLRYLISIAVIVAEIALVIGLVVLACIYSPYLYFLAVALQIWCVIKIISSDNNPDYKAPWLLVVIVLPIIGFTLYFLFYSRQLGKLYVKRLNALSKGSYKKDDGVTFAALKNEDALAYTHAKMLCNTGILP